MTHGVYMFCSDWPASYYNFLMNEVNELMQYSQWTVKIHVLYSAVRRRGSVLLLHRLCAIVSSDSTVYSTTESPDVHVLFGQNNRGMGLINSRI